MSKKFYRISSTLDLFFQIAEIDGNRGDEGPAGPKFVGGHPTKNLRRRRFHRSIQGRRSRRAHVGRRPGGEVRKFLRQSCVCLFLFIKRS
jgi:hypothetical protein